MNDITIKTDFIKLDSFLKLAGIAQTGGHAKILIKDGKIKVNDQVCLMRGKKLRNGDIVDFLGEKYIVKEYDH